ncbi:MAG: PKD domain-containing protein [Chitinophagaceae bacterium]|nr:PKD domain-containing protein [Chitinophagaceae bacterium]
MKQIALTRKSVPLLIATTFYNSSSIFRKCIPFLITLCCLTTNVGAQVIQLFDFTAPSDVYVAGIGGYDKPNVGSYHVKASGGAATFTSASPACFGYSLGAKTSSSLFIFKSTGTVNSIEINAFSTSSNRTLTGFAISPTLNGTYTNAGFTTTGTINSNECGTIICVPTTQVAPGTFMRFTFSGNFETVVSLKINVKPIGSAPTVTTTNITAGINTANITGTVNAGLPAPSMPIDYYGVIWNTVNTGIDINLSTKTAVTPATINTFPGSFTNQATGLIPNGTQYYGRTYVKALDGNVYYGAIMPFITLPPTLPTVTTNAASNIFSNRATSGGNVTDSGGVTIVQKGICWSTSPNPTTALSTKTTQGLYSTNFSSLITGLTPSTTYYVRAYAENSVGVTYGNEIQFITSVAVPVIAATPTTIAFGTVNYNGSQPVLSYLLNGQYLSPAAGTITVQAPTGYEVSTLSNSGFGATTTFNYTNNAFASKRIYVRFKTNAYGVYNGAIIQTGGGTIPVNVDTVFASGIIAQDPNVLTNSGTDFWLGNGYQERNDRKSGDANEGKLSVYIAAGDQAAVVNVELPGIPGAAGFPKNNITIPANTVVEIKDFPTGSSSNNMNPTGLPDARLFYTGISKRGIHVSSSNGAPVSVWMHTYAPNNSAAAAMVFPTNTWNSAYTVQAFGGQPTDTKYVGGFTNNSNPNSFFFVVANEDNTPIWFTPSQDILDSVPAAIFTEGHDASMVKYNKGITYGPFILNKGEIFNAMGFIKNSGNDANGLDLTGSKVWTNCDKKIAVFGGNGRCLVNAPTCTSIDQGSDHLIQQMFPKVAWGTKYISVPTKTMEYNLYRITVDDPTTRVWINNPLHTTPQTGLINNLYYQFASKESLLIESDKPINVTQFITAGGCANSNGSKGNGDPEMIILSPVQQAINKVTVYSAPIKKSGANYNGHYINVVIKKEGLASFRLNNVAVADTGINQTTANAGTCYNTAGSIPIINAFVKHTFDTNYYVAKFRVLPNTSNTLKSDYPFNAIAYGMGDGESYGYNAGTAIKNLSSISVAQNPFGTDTSTASVKTCVNNPVRLQIALPYLLTQVDSILWDSGASPYVSPAGIVRGGLTPNPGNPGTFYATSTGSIVVDGRTYFLYSSPPLYNFSQEGTFQVTAIAKGTFISECGSESRHIINVTVGHDDIAFTAVNGACGSTSVTFTDNSTPLAGTSIQQWQWSFGDGTNYTATPPNPNPVPNPHVYPPLSSGVSSYWAKLKTINSVGCFSEDSVFVDLSFDLNAKFTVSKDTICAGTSVTFNDLSSSSAVEWVWDWNDGSPNTVVTGTAPAAPQSHTFNTAGTFNVKLYVKNAAGCLSAIKDTNIVVIAKPVVDFQTPPGICLGGSMSFTNLTTPTTGVTYLWNFNDPNATVPNPNTSTVKDPSHIYTSTGPFNVSLTVTLNGYGCADTKTKALSSTIYQLPTAVITAPATACLRDSTVFSSTSSTGGSGNTVTMWNWDFGGGVTSTLQNPKHAYTTTGVKTVTLTVTSDKGCISAPVTHNITLNPTPNVTYTAIPNVCANASAFNLTQFTETTGLPGSFTYTGTGVSGNSFNPATSGVGTFQVIATYNTSNGCKDADTTSVTVWPLPTVDFTIGTLNCEKSAITFADNSVSNGGALSNWSWNFGDATANGIGSSTSHTYQTANSYTVTLTVKNGNNCVASGSKPLVVRNRPFANFSLPTAVCLPSGAATFTNLSTVADDANPTYTWDFGNPNNSTGSTLPNPTHSYSSTGPFTVKLTVKSQYNCTKDTSKILSAVYPEPVADFTATPSEVCLNDTIRFTSASIGTVVTRNWDLGDGNTTTTNNVAHKYAAVGTYSVSYYHINDKGCKSNTKVKSVKVNSYPFVDAGAPLWVLQGGSIQLQPTVSGSNLSYKWTPSLYLNYDTLLKPISTPLADKLYTLTVTGNGGCAANDTVRVRILLTPVIPNAFSPNGDGINDTWDITYLNNYVGATVDVFSRNGQTVFSNIGYSKPWDGTYNGKPLPIGVYYFVINPKNGLKLMTGTLTILR